MPNLIPLNAEQVFATETSMRYQPSFQETEFFVRARVPLPVPGPFNKDSSIFFIYLRALANLPEFAP